MVAVILTLAALYFGMVADESLGRALSMVGVAIVLFLVGAKSVR
jgi:hypothetical protein